ncbi:RNase A-like domain-containing protein [Nocardioides pyridinolyticus]
MRLAVEGAGYRFACDAFVDGNQAAARVGVDLSGELGAFAGMAGDDATATDFAASYDDAATTAVEALAELVAGFASLARLTDRSLRNHAAAERASVLPGWPEQVVDPPAGADLCTVVHLPGPPSALGRDSSSLPGWANTVLDLLEGVFWPDADTDRLRAAAATWRSAGGAVGLLTDACATALAELSLEVSPEIPLAIATTEDLRARIESLAEQLSALGAACEEYAAHVDAKRAEMLDLLEQLAWELGIGAVASGALTFLTAGAAAPAAGAAGAARLAATSQRLRGILESLGLLTRGTSSTVRPVGAALRESRAYLARLSAARTERGSANLASYFSRRRWEPGWLDAHEAGRRGHTIRDHVGKSAEEMADRLARKPSLTRTSTFPDKATAERAAEAVFKANARQIRAWLASGTGKEDFVANVGEDVGYVLVRGASERVTAQHARIVLIRDDSMPEGWRLLTSFPEIAGG